ncbi:MAG: hypothetical protein RR426_07600 [Oscillospiraceae bacterium]
MTDFETTLRSHGAAYGRMLPQDAVKLCYQAEFGGEHLVTDAPGTLANLTAEYQTAAGNTALLEDCGEAVSRIYLGAAREAGLSPALLTGLFVQSAQGHTGTQEGLLRRLELLRHCVEGFSFSLAQLDSFLADYLRADCPALHHSAAYRTAYAPAYRLISRRFVPLLPLLTRIEALLGEGRRLVLALDGNCGSGKTTLAGELAALYGAPVIHMDDFFLPPPLRTEERKALGNVHYERFQTEVLTPLLQGHPFDYRVFSCQSADYSGTVHVECAPLTIVEGSYSCHPYFGQCYDLRVFVETPPETQELRIRARNGGACWQRFHDAWIPLETAYFSQNHIREQADCIICT